MDPNKVHEDVQNEDPIQPDSGTAPEPEEEQAQEEQEPTLRRSSRAAREPSRLQPIFGGKSYAQVQDPDPDPEPSHEWRMEDLSISL